MSHFLRSGSSGGLRKAPRSAQGSSGEPGSVPLTLLTLLEGRQGGSMRPIGEAGPEGTQTVPGSFTESQFDT
eukprot:2326942-Alexandrium_andersonii.AAC.1